MRRISPLLTALLLVLTAATSIPAVETTAPVPDNRLGSAIGKASAAAVARWHEAKSGLFVHWGVYSVYGGTYHGKELWSAEGIQENARVPWEEYSKTAAAWNPSQFDAEAWVRLARDAGMRYLVMTAKHHDGFAMYRSRASRYNLMDWSKYRGPDPLAALKAACRKHGLLFGIYYSPLEFRTSPKGFDAEDEKAVANGFDYRTLGPQPYASNADVVRQAQAQIKELAENYRPDIFWFDGTWNKMGTWTEADGLQAERAIRAAVPEVLINNRLGIKAADFDVYENQIPASPPARAWEYCWNLGVFWGYNPRNYRPDLVKTPRHYVETLAHITSLGGNYLLNVGPAPTGQFHPMAVEYLTKIGQWVRANGECIYGGAAMIQLQGMIPQTPGDRLHFFPAWPKDWDVDFKLLTLGQKTVEAVLRGGKFVSLKVTPNSRAKDIVNWLGKQPPYQPPPAPLSQGKRVTVSSQFNQPGYDAARAVDGDLKTRWASDFAARDGWLAVDLGEEKEIGRAWISQIEWPETQEFTIEIKQDDTWREIIRGTTIGADKAIEFPPVRAREICLRVLKAERPININEFQVFRPDQPQR